MADFNAVAKEVFQVLRSFDYTVRLYDENSMATTEPEEARRFVAYPKNLMVSLLDDDDNSRITLSMGKSTQINDVMGLNQKLRTLSTKYNMVFRAQQYGKKIDPKHFTKVASISEGRMQVFEEMYGTSRSSYLRLEQARMIVRHKARIDDQIDARGRSIEAVFVENAVGERHQMPTADLTAGRAMTQHINQRGGFADPLGQQITRIAEDYGNLRSGAQAALRERGSRLREACRKKMGRLRETLERLAQATSYAAEAAALDAKRLNETTATAATRVAEVKPLFRRVQPRAVYECCCKALDEMQSVKQARRVPPVSGFREHVAWLKRFDPQRLLTEWDMAPPAAPLDALPVPDASFEQAEQTAITDFNADYFVESPEMQDIIGGRDPHDPAHNDLAKDDIVAALQAYLRHYIETSSPEFNNGYTGDSDGLVPAVLDKAIEALHQRGFIVSDASLVEAIGSGEELTSEDVLLPSPDKGVDLRGEVSKADIADPDNPDAHGKPDTNYTSRLMTLAGMRTGVPY